MDKQNDKNFNELALFKFSLIAPVVNDTFSAVSQAQYFREIASKSHTMPNGKSVKISAGTLKSWYLRYKRRRYRCSDV